MVFYICTIYGGLLLIGCSTSWIGQLLGLRGTESQDGTVPLVLVGAVTLIIPGWYLLAHTGVGITHLVKLLLLLGVLAVGIRMSLERPSARDLVQRIWKQHWVGLVSALVFAVVWWPLLRFGYLTSAGTNNDIISYAQVAQHIERNGFADAGRIVGAHLGLTARNDVTGAYILVAFARVIIRRPFNQLMFPVLGTFVAVLAQQLFLLLKRHGQLRASTSLAIVLVAQTSYMMSYIFGCYFLAQVIAMSAFAALICALISGGQRTDLALPAWKGLMSLAPVLVPATVMLFCYPHMLFVAAPMAVAAFVPLGNWKKLVTYVSSAGLWLFLALLVAPERSHAAITRFLQLSNDSVNGWKLPVITPIELVSFQTSESVGPRLWKWVASALLLVLAAAGALFARTKKGRILKPGMLLALLGVSYVYFSVTASFSYKQWKWTTFFLPMFVVLIIWLIVRAWDARPSHRLWIPAVLFLLIVINVHNSWKFTRLVAESTPRVPYEMTQLARNNALRQLEEVNVFSGDYLRSMWPALFLDPLKVDIVNLSYYTAPRPAPAPTVVDASFPVDPWKRTDLGAGLALVDYPQGETSETSDNLAADVRADGVPSSVPAGQTFKIRAHVVNTGEAAWLGDGSPGAVSLGARLLDPLTGGLVSEIGRSLIVPFPNYLARGELREIDIEVTIPQLSGRYDLEIIPFVDKDKWFDDSAGKSSVKFSVVIG